MIYKYTKCESVIAKIMADLDSSEVKLRITDIKEWIFEAIDKIGAPMLYISKESGSNGGSILKILDNQVPIPSDLVILDAVAYSMDKNGPWIPMSTTTAIFKEPQRKEKPIIIQTHDLSNKAVDNHFDVINKDELKPKMMKKLPTSQSLFYTNSAMKYAQQMMIDNELLKAEYFIKPGWIVTNKDKGYIKLAYKAIATDERGYPLIPDLSSYQEAVYWYVVMKLNFPKFLKGKLGGKGVNNNSAVYTYLQQQWNFYRNQAYAEAMMPTADDMLNIKNDWNKLIPDWDGDDSFFKYIGSEQKILNDYYYGY